MRVRRVVGVVLVVVLATGLSAGCQSAEPKPKMPRVTESASPAPAESSPPESESAEEFIRRWHVAGDEVQGTGETAAYAAMGPECESCMGFVESVNDVYSEGGHAEFKGSTIKRLVRVGMKPPTFDLTKDVSETVIHYGDGRVERLPAGRTTIRVTLGRRDGEWVVVLVGIL